MFIKLTHKIDRYSVYKNTESRCRVLLPSGHPAFTV